MKETGYVLARVNTLFGVTDIDAGLASLSGAIGDLSQMAGNHIGGAPAGQVH